MYGKSIRYCGEYTGIGDNFFIAFVLEGFALNWDEIVYEGSPEDGKFAAFFVK